jgi:hypothetical protein
VQWVESMWSKKSFYTSRISRNSLDPEMLMGGWDTLYLCSKTFRALLHFVHFCRFFSAVRKSFGF